MKLWSTNSNKQIPFSHTVDLIAIAAERYRKEPLLSYPIYKTDKLKEIEGAEFATKCIDAAKALVAFGITPEEAVGIYSPNRQEILYCELGLYAIRGICVPFYFTSSPEQVEYICRRTQIKLIFVGEQYQYNNAYQVQCEKGQIERIVIFDHRVVKQFGDTTSIYYDEFVRLGDAMRNETEVKRRMGECLLQDTALYMFTSGTTGEPKGVIIKHSMLVSQLNAHQALYSFIGRGDVSADFLPQSHIFEKMWVYFCLLRGVTIAIISDPHRVQFLMPHIKPTVMCNVPRYWEKIYAGILEKVQKESRWKQKLFWEAIRKAKRYRLSFRNEGRRAPLLLTLYYRITQRLFFHNIKLRLGLQRGYFFPTAGAYLSDTINAFLQACGFPIIVGYGLSESCATVSAYPQQGYIIGSVGKVIDNVKVRIDPATQEIQLKGDSITEGYFEDPQATKKAFTADGWFKTGDRGRLEGRTLYFQERIKDLFKTANGKYIAPQQIESLLLADPCISQVVCIANDRHFVSALIYPEWKILTDLALQRGIIQRVEPPETLCRNVALKKMLMARIEQLQGGLATFEKVKRIALLAAPLSEEKGELTPTLKLRRGVIEEHYHTLIEALYAP